ncbi:CehA/McbA family metallohydrolase [soil metagenome]
MKLLAWCSPLVTLLVACAAPDVAPPLVPIPAPPPPQDTAPAILEAAPDAAVPQAEPEVWLKGSTHVHAQASGDASTKIADVITWYQDRGYDFLVLTDHNRVSEIEGDTQGSVALRPTVPNKLIVISGIELTHNPSGCLPVGDKNKKCRIHVNVLGPTARPGGKLEWAERHSHERLDMYRAALMTARALSGAVVQLNHPQWFWGMTGDLLAELVKRGVALVEIANVQFTTWNLGDKDHPSTEQLWDDVLSRGLTVWGTASDDAHDYPAVGAHRQGKWPAGGGWVVVKAHRDPQAILAALAAGHFYASTGVVLAKAEVEANELVIEVDPNQPGTYTIDWIEAGKVIATDHGMAAHREVPATGYLRADVRRGDGTEAWVEPARR